jgi:hypothetical protein
MLSRVFRSTEKEMHDISGPAVAAAEDIQQILT